MTSGTWPFVERLTPPARSGPRSSPCPATANSAATSSSMSFRDSRRVGSWAAPSSFGKAPKRAQACEAALWSQFTVPAYRRPCRPSAPRCATSPWLCRNLPTRSILLLPPAAVAAAIAPWGCAEAREQRKPPPSADASSSSAGGRHPASPRRADSGSDAVSCWSLRRTCWWPCGQNGYGPWIIGVPGWANAGEPKVETCHGIGSRWRRCMPGRRGFGGWVSRRPSVRDIVSGGGRHWTTRNRTCSPRPTPDRPGRCNPLAGGERGEPRQRFWRAPRKK